MKILITNDDGIHAEGLYILRDIARNFVAHESDIYISAPQTEQSGVSHALSYVTPIQVTQKDANTIAVHGTPADCVLVALSHFDVKFDLVLSGVNIGHNLGPELYASGTVGGAIEASLNGLKAISISQYYSKATHEANHVFSVAKTHGAKVIGDALTAMSAHWQYGHFLNVNFPACHHSAVKGVRITGQGREIQPIFKATKEIAPNHREYYWLSHPAAIDSHETENDIARTKAGYITITPCQLNLTDFNVMNGLRQLEQEY